MYELVQVGENTFYMDCPSKVGFYRTGGNEIVIIDSGNDKDAGKKVRKILDAQGWQLKAIYNTHSHADHVGGNQYLQNLYGCKVYCAAKERCVVEHPDFEPDMLYGGFPMKDLRCKFLMAPPSEPCLLTPECLPEGLEIIELPGHCFGMVGFRTSDDVVFLADALSSAETLVKYRLGFVYDLKAYFETLEMVKTIDASCFVPSHAPQTDNIVPLADLNIEKTKENAELILQLISTPKIFEDILTGVFNYFGIGMNVIQYVLVGSTVKSYLSWLKDTGKAEFYFENNRMLWKSI